VAVRVSDNRYEHDIRKHNLAKWMVSCGARTKTVTQWTGLPRHRVQALSRRYQNKVGDHRRRGISPFQTAFFGKSLLLETESLVFTFLACELQVLPEQGFPEARRHLPGLDRGERLKSAYELYLALVPDTSISLERAILLVVEFAGGQSLSLRRCRTCPLPMVIERVGVQHDQCPACRSRKRSAVSGQGEEAAPG
jgi:Flagellar transcriptional activator (FlhC)